jgi:hypothetical protein
LDKRAKIPARLRLGLAAFRPLEARMRRAGWILASLFPLGLSGCLTEQQPLLADPAAPVPAFLPARFTATPIGDNGTPGQPVSYVQRDGRLFQIDHDRNGDVVYRRINLDALGGVYLLEIESDGLIGAARRAKGGNIEATDLSNCAQLPPARLAVWQVTLKNSNCVAHSRAGLEAMALYMLNAPPDAPWAVAWTRWVIKAGG